MKPFASKRLAKRKATNSKLYFDTTMLVLMCIFALAVSLLVLIKSSIRLDEAQSLFQTNRDFLGMLKVVGQDVHVPLYHTLLHGWQKLFGSGITVARSMSVIFFLALIPLTYLLGRYALDRKTGLFAALLVTISPFTNWYGSEARMYAMLAFMTVLHQLLFLKVIREGKPIHWLGFILIAIAGLYTHYFFALVLFTEGVYFLYKYKEITAGRKKLLLKFLAVVATVFVAFSPWVLYVYSLGTASNTQPRLTAPGSIDIFNTYAQFIFGLQTDQINTFIVSLWPLAVLLAFFALQKNKKVPKYLIFFVLFAALPIAAAFILSITVKPFYLSRYLIVSLPALCIFVSWIVCNYKRPVSTAIKVLLVIAVGAGLLVQVANPDTPVKEDYKDAAQYLEQNATAKDGIVASAPFTIYPLEYYYRGPAGIETLPIWNRFKQGAIPAFDKNKLPEQAKLANGSSQRVFLVLSFDQGYQDDIYKYYEGHYKLLAKKKFSNDVSVYTYQLRYDPVPTIRQAEINTGQRP